MAWELISVPRDDAQHIVTGSSAKARFLVDESLGEGTVEALNELKWNVVGVWTEGLVGCSDEKVFAYSRKKRRILLTHDADFLDDRRFPLYPQPGIIVLPGGEGDTAALLEALYQVLPTFQVWPDLCRDAKVQVLRGQELRIRSRDAANGKEVEARYRFERPDRVYSWEP